MVVDVSGRVAAKVVAVVGNKQQAQKQGKHEAEEKKGVVGATMQPVGVATVGSATAGIRWRREGLPAMDGARGGARLVMSCCLLTSLSLFFSFSFLDLLNKALRIFRTLLRY